MKQFEYYEPDKIEDVCLLLSQFGKEAKILAGGTDLVVQMKRGFLVPKHVVNIKKIQDLNFIKEKSTGYSLGTLCNIADIAAHPGLQKYFPVITESARSIGSAQIRNLATLGGNLCNASPSADMAPGLLALEANVVVHGLRGGRMLPLIEFFLGPGKVDLGKDEMLVEINIPFPDENTKMIYYKLGPRKAMDCAVVSLAIAIRVDELTGECQKARISLGAVAETALRLREVESIIERKIFSEINRAQIAKAVREGITPIDDVRGSAEYRYETAASLTIRAIDALMEPFQRQNHGKKNIT